MNKIKMLSIFMLLILSISMVSAFNVEEKAKNTAKMESSILAKWYWNTMNSYVKVLRENRLLKAEIQELKDNPIIEYRTRTKTKTITNTEYVICEDCPVTPYCPPPKVLKYDGLDECGCKINLRCTYNVEILPAPKLE